MALEWINKSELAWAAGFFDGEGSTSYRHANRMKTPILVIGQTDTFVLERFKNAVGCGVIYGPFPYPNRPTHKPKWNYHSGKFENTQQALILLWPYLSPQKKEQATRVFKQHLEMQAKYPDVRAKNGRCKYGHDYTIENGLTETEHKGKIQRRCTQCLIVKKSKNAKQSPRHSSFPAITA